VALLTFPFPVADGTIYPVSPPAGTNIYQWVSAEQTWRLLGSSTGVSAGTYGTPLAVPQITIDATGRITVANNVPFQLADTAQVGLVQLVDDTISNDPTKALTAAMGYRLANEIGDTSLLNPFYPNLVTAVNALGAPSGVTSGTYGNGANVGQFTVNAQGRITSAVNVPLSLATTVSPGVIRVGANLNITGAGILSVPNSSTAQRGVVQLVNNTTTNDATKALTAASGYDLQLQIDALEARNNLTFAGTIDGATGRMLTVTAQGAAVGFTVGAVLPSPAPLNDEYFVVVTVPGTFTPTGGAPQATNDGDWFVSDGSQWLYYNVGPTVAAATFIQLDDISGQFNGTRVSFVLRVSGSPYTPSSASAILLSVGGVIQVPGNSFTLAGSTVTFSEAPKTGTTFVGYAISGMTGGGGGGGGGGTGTVTSVGTGTGLIGGPVTTTGTISLRPATNSTLGGVIPDNTTITVSPTGVISVVGSGAGNLQTVTDNGNVTTRSITVGGLASTGTTTLGDASSDLIYFLGRIATSFLPNVTETYDLGSPTQRWKDLYVSSNSIYMGANQLTVSGGQLLLNGSPVGGGGTVGTLQQVTTAGNTTTNLMKFVDTGSGNDAIHIDGQNSQITLYPQAIGEPGLYLNSAAAFFGNSVGWFGAGGLFPAAIDFTGSSGTSIKTGDATIPVQLWAGGRGGVTIPQVSVTGTTTTVNNNLKVEGYIQATPNGIRFYESSAVDYVGLNAPSSLGASYGLTLPPEDGTADQVLATDGTGDLQWLTTAKIVAVPASSASGGAAGQIAFGGGFFYWFDSGSNQWLRVAGSTF